MEAIDNPNILHWEQKLLAAMQTQDLPTLESLIDDDLLFVIPSRQTVNKEMDLANIRSGNLHIDTIEAKDHQIQNFGDIVLVSVRVHLKGRFLEQEIEGDFQYFRTWQRQGEVWKVIGGAGVPIQS